MNQYGSQAQKYWRENLPTQYAQITDRTRFFTDMGEQMGERIDELSRQIAGPDPGGEEYLAKVGRLNRARNEAEMTIMMEMLPEAEDDQDELEPGRDDGWGPILPFH